MNDRPASLEPHPTGTGTPRRALVPLHGSMVAEEWSDGKSGRGDGAARRDRSVSDLPVLPVVHAPVGTGVAMTVELKGEVPYEAVRGAVVHIVQGTARKLRRAVEIDDRLSIDRQAAAVRGA